MSFLDDYEAELLAAANTPQRIREDKEALVRSSARAAEEHRRGVELGWFDEEGNSLDEQEDEDDEDLDQYWDGDEG